MYTDKTPSFLTATSYITLFFSENFKKNLFFQYSNHTEFKTLEMANFQSIFPKGILPKGFALEYVDVKCAIKNSLRLIIKQLR